MPKPVIVIPARYASSRLPGKILRDLGGKPMVQHVWERAVQSRVGQVFIATDDARIADVAKAFGAQVEMTAADHASGTDRLAEVATRLQLADDQIVVNVQGDEPLIPPAIIRQVADNLAARSDMQMATLAEPLSAEEFHDPGAVKVVSNRFGQALYFSRATIPWHRDAFAKNLEAMPATDLLRRHVGIYAYRAGFLASFVTSGPCALEQAEALEQLRALYHGAAIHVADAVEAPGPGVDTEADLQRAAALLQASGT
jgi:3-deoxy-manno-octulosonate cytidylyltransferase (CMP-KDO synthetase)